VKVAVVLLLYLFTLVFAQDKSFERLAREAKAKGEVVLNFQDVEIKDLALFMGELVGKNVVVDGRVAGKLTLHFSKPMKVREAWEVFTLAISTQGFGVLEGDKVVRILPVSDAINVAEIKESPFRGEVAILIFNFSQTDAQSAMSALKPFLSPFARVSLHAPSNSLIIADLGENIRKAKKILEDIDKVSVEGEVKVYKLKYLSAKDAANMISPLGQTISGKFGGPLSLSSSEEANALIVVAPRKAQELIERILSEVDTEGAVSEVRSFYIIPLKFISAEEASQSLQSLLTGTKKEPSPRPPKTVPEVGKTEEKKAPSPAPEAPRKESPEPLQVITTKEGMRVGFDRGTNSVILYGTKSEYEGLKKLISELDTRRRQVLIAATIVEASTKSLLDIGVRWQILGKHGGTSFRGSTLTDIYASFASGNFLIGAFSSAGRTISVGGANLFFPDLVLLFSLLETGSGFNIISNPRVLTLDNQPAVIKVGQVVPYAEGLKFDINGQPIITYNYKEVGLELGVTPRISENNLRLTVDLTLQEIIDFITNQIGATSYTVPVTSNRKLSSDVVVENGQTIILGGLVSTKTLKSMEGVPGLWKIPILGRLFRRDVEQNDKTTLFIFITPYVVSSPEELSRITEEHRKLSEEIKRRIEERKENREERDEEILNF